MVKTLMASYWCKRRSILKALSAMTMATQFPLPVIARGRDLLTRRSLEFLDNLTVAQKQQCHTRFATPERLAWHYTPRQRPGLPLKTMTPAQREQLWAILKAVLSNQGLRKTRAVIKIERILAELSGNFSFRDPENYAIVLFGDPGSNKPWSLRFEGHHLSLTFTIVPNQGIAVTPMFLGANPATVPSDHAHAGFQALGEEQDIAFRLINGLPEALQSQAVISSHSLGNIVTGPGREASLAAPKGLAVGAMPESQRNQALALIKEYVANVRSDLAHQQLKMLFQNGGQDALYLAWAGSLTPDRPHYFRLHGPTLIIEYDNTQNDANHIHSVWHDRINEFGQDLLSLHYATEHKLML
jgi:hypothetical protein